MIWKTLSSQLSNVLVFSMTGRGLGPDWQPVWLCMQLWSPGGPVASFTVPFMTRANLPPAEILPQLFTDLYPHFPRIHLTPHPPPPQPTHPPAAPTPPFSLL